MSQSQDTVDWLHKLSITLNFVLFSSITIDYACKDVYIRKIHKKQIPINQIYIYIVLVNYKNCKQNYLSKPLFIKD